MDVFASPPLTRERNLILALLLVLAGLAWAFLLWQSSRLMDAEQMGLTMGMGAPLFLLIWVVMMVAMMFPSAAPMVLMFARLHAGRREHGQTFVPTWVFVAAYLVVWVGFGALAYLLALAAGALASQSSWVMNNAARIGGAVLVLAGLYQVSPLKMACLSRCRSPFSFIMSSWRDGYLGAIRMGLSHGLYCLGCCWMLFVILFPVGVMNVAAMAVLTLLIFAEKSLRFGRQLAWVAAAVLVAYGGWLLLAPGPMPAAM